MKLLRTLDAAAFPDLVADILHFVRGHGDIKVTDGKGDGKRDIASRDSNGHRHVTQCKYHRGAGSVGTSEVDEIGRALVKFGVKRGLFATTGRLSPQAKRELIDDFPGYEVDFLEGDAIVDLVLSHGALKGAWFNGDTITEVASGVQIPFVIRALNGSPLTVPDFDGEVGGARYRIFHEYFDRGTFEPYREPRHHVLQPAVSYQVATPAATIHGSSVHRQLGDHQRKLVSLLKKQIAEKTWSIRFGKAVLTDVAGQVLKPEIAADNEPVTYVVSKRRSPRFERDYLLPGQPWQFSEGLRVSQTEWARWYRADLDLCLDVEFVSPLSADSLHQHNNITKNREHWWSQSRFGVLSEQAARVLLEEQRVVAPSFQHQWIGGSTFLGWLHPMFESALVTIWESEPGELEAELNPLRDEMDHVARMIESVGGKVVDPGRAYHMLASLEDEEPIPKPALFSTSGAYAYFQWSSLPSPVWISDRRLHFDSAWRLPNMSEAQRAALSEQLPATWRGHPVFNDTFGSDARAFVLVRIIIAGGELSSTNEAIEAVLPTVQEFFTELDAQITKLVSAPVRATKALWEEQFGVQFTPGPGKGEVVFFAEDGRALRRVAFPLNSGEDMMLGAKTNQVSKKSAKKVPAKRTSSRGRRP